MPMTGLNLSKTLLAANNIVPSPTEKTDQKLDSLHVLLPECTPALSLCAFILITNQASWTKIQWDKTTDTFQIGVVTTEFKMANMTGKSTTYLTAIHAQAIECGRSKL